MGMRDNSKRALRFQSLDASAVTRARLLRIQVRVLGSFSVTGRNIGYSGIQAMQSAIVPSDVMSFAVVGYFGHRRDVWIGGSPAACGFEAFDESFAILRFNIGRWHRTFQFYGGRRQNSAGYLRVPGWLIEQSLTWICWPPWRRSSESYPTSWRRWCSKRICRWNSCGSAGQP